MKVLDGAPLPQAPSGAPLSHRFRLAVIPCWCPWTWTLGAGMGRVAAAVIRIRDVAAFADMTFSFRNRFRLNQGTRFASDLPSVELSEPGGSETVLLHTPNLEDKIDDAIDLVLTGGGYATFAEAEDAGRKWRHQLMVALAKFDIGADFGDADDIEPKFGDGTIGSQVITDKLGLQVLECDESVVFGDYPVEFSHKKSLEAF